MTDEQRGPQVIDAGDGLVLILGAIARRLPDAKLDACQFRIFSL